jgi:hypothetical protein
MTVFRLPRLPLNWNKQPQLFERYWDEAMTNIEKTLNEILVIPEIQTAIDAANAAAAAANTAAGNAQNAADTNSAENSLVNSYIDSTSFTAPLISASSTGTITIQTHTRVYGDPTLNPNVSVTGQIGMSTGAASGDTVRVFYNDPTRAGGAVTYQFTIDPAAPPVQTGDTHSVGSVIIPSTGTSGGKYVKPPGYVEA